MGIHGLYKWERCGNPPKLEVLAKGASIPQPSPISKRLVGQGRTGSGGGPTLALLLRAREPEKFPDCQLGNFTGVHDIVI